MERHRREDLERADAERHHQQKLHEAQMQLLQDQLNAISSKSSDSNKTGQGHGSWLPNRYDSCE